jgi:hypothetical protein
MRSLVNTGAGYFPLAGFLISLLVIFEERLHLRKSKPVVLIGCLMRMFIVIHERRTSSGHAG